MSHYKTAVSIIRLQIWNQPHLLPYITFCIGTWEYSLRSFAVLYYWTDPIRKCCATNLYRNHDLFYASTEIFLVWLTKPQTRFDKPKQLWACYTILDFPKAWQWHWRSVINQLKDVRCYMNIRNRMALDLCVSIWSETRERYLAAMLPFKRLHWYTLEEESVSWRNLKRFHTLKNWSTVNLKWCLGKSFNFDVFYFYKILKYRGS
mgnify:CR=1 FL=1